MSLKLLLLAQEIKQIYEGNASHNFSPSSPAPLKFESEFEDGRSRSKVKVNLKVKEAL